MKQYPRIYSLATLGVRHHQEFDYPFHPFRTDFVGDSGCGKSMIADLLQLIFVGSGSFRSPTQSNGKRDPSGMVLPVSGSRGTGIGYAFLNVEVEQGRFVAIGIYLEDTSNTVQHFVVQAGYEENELQPFDLPLVVADLTARGRIPGLEEAEYLVHERGLFRRVLTRKKFHSWLYRHGILPLDLSESDKILNDYASIIQSFSRGPNLKIGESNSLKEFLFGPEKATEMYAKYEQAVSEMHEATREYALNRQEIADVIEKQTAIHELRSLKSARNASLREWLTASYAYSSQQESAAQNAVRELVKSTKDGLANLEVYRDIIADKLRMSDSTAANLEQKSDDSIAAFRTASEPYAALQKALALIAKLGCDPSQLATIYARNRALLDEQKLRENLQHALTSCGVLPLFKELLTPDTTLDSLSSSIAAGYTEKQRLMEQQEAMLEFSDINQQGTFGQWAVQQGRALSREVESILMHYKSVLLRKAPEPCKGDKAIAQPDLLLREEPSITADEKGGGFWLSLDGVDEYIPYVDKQLFHETTLGDLKQQLKAMAAASAENLKTLRTECGALEALRKCIWALPAPQEALAAWLRTETAGLQQPIEDLNISKEEADKYGRALENANNIEQEHNQRKREMQSAMEQHSNYKTLVTELKAMLADTEGALGTNRWNDELQAMERNILASGYYNNATAIRTQTELEEGHANSVSTFYRERIMDARGRVKIFQAVQAWETYDASAVEKKERWAEYSREYGEAPQTDATMGEHLEEPKQAREAYATAEANYNARFDGLVRQYCPADGHKFVTTRNYEELCATILPDILGRERPKGESEIEAIERHLHAINDNVNKLNNRKLQKIKDLLDEVRDESESRMLNAHLIDNFLNKEEREITGGHRVRLIGQPSRQYPIDWMLQYADRLGAEGELFTPVGRSIADLTATGISLEEKMLEAFRNLAGTKSPDVNIQKLLDPNSYFDLTFSMRSKSDGANKGSSGQTYTAIALLCVARLSLVARSGVNKARGLRFMPIDEAEGLGTNYDLLHQIAKEFDYQIVSMSINPLGKFNTGGQYLYGLAKDVETDEDVNIPPLGFFNDATDIADEA